MCIFLLIFTLCRLLFLLFNQNSFPVVYFTDFIAGAWFDVVTTCIVFLPLAAIELFPNKLRSVKTFRLIFIWAFHITLFLCILINIIDIEYFKFSAARSTTSLFTMLSFGNDLTQQLPSYFVDYWYLLLFLVLLQILGWWLYRRVNRMMDDSDKTSWLKQLLIFPLVAAFLVIVGRGGFGLRPIAAPKAASYTIDQNIPLVLNSAFTVIKTWGSVTLKEKNYFTDKELIRLFNPVQQYGNFYHPISNNNVCILLVESFSVEYIASINGTNNIYTPFLDSLINESLVFTHCYSNGKKSIDAMPSIISSIPKLMEIEYLTSQYAANKIESLPKYLSGYGYESAFFHGATNGSMNFDVFCAMAGFNHYYGRSEYANDAHYDGTWGIYDEEFLLWSANKINQLKSPFFTTLFTISSHPPYALPDRYKNVFNQGPEAVHNSVRYTDYALQQFFEKIKNTDWYANTLFVIVADHTPASGSDIYYKDMGNMHIPLVFFHPSFTDLKGRNSKVVGQIDIMPSIIDLLGYDKPFFSFGKSVFSDNKGSSASFIGNKYIYFADVDSGAFMLTYQDENVTGIYALTDQLQIENRIGDVDLKNQLVKGLHAIIQTYNSALIKNEMTIN